MHVLVKDTADQKEILKEIHTLLKKDFSVYFSTIQVETECLDEKEASDIDINAHSSHSNHVQNTKDKPFSFPSSPMGMHIHIHHTTKTFQFQVNLLCHHSL
jgi:predicted nuclease of predicted toxin-antitoxin system